LFNDFLDFATVPSVLTLHKVWCYPIQFVTPTLRLPPVEYMADKDQTYVRFNGERLLINTLYLQKLVRHIIMIFLFSLQKLKSKSYLENVAGTIISIQLL